ncbi:hypothetical protein BDK51DRAFT_45449 [Blyttiomyces helicus]|uniref:Uncharacterized protein n=1 Tax=Blyttiomyces helicus TaxID=388810 RepID=A0A4P9WE93_9FUNG|nr:hypothetical protein BDK51DRAFT_45449 [Blyttiomyces helicus]|eukprot:RKO90904.1 hypothetical protein BDK51DRAFT_45449 [Blyttiomyces helicus]
MKMNLRPSNRPRFVPTSPPTAIVCPDNLFLIFFKSHEWTSSEQGTAVWSFAFVCKLWLSKIFRVVWENLLIACSVQRPLKLVLLLATCPASHAARVRHLTLAVPNVILATGPASHAARIRHLTLAVQSVILPPDPPLLEHLPNLPSLVIGFGDEKKGEHSSLQWLGSMFKACPLLEALGVASKMSPLVQVQLPDKIKDLDVRLPSLLEKCSDLLELDLGYNMLSPEIFNTLRSICPRLKVKIRYSHADKETVKQYLTDKDGKMHWLTLRRFCNHQPKGYTLASEREECKVDISQILIESSLRLVEIKFGIEVSPHGVSHARCAGPAGPDRRQHGGEESFLHFGSEGLVSTYFGCHVKGGKAPK